MIPRAVQMAKAVSDIIGSADVEEYGNIISKPYKGWSNIYGSYFLGSPGSSLSDTLGNPAMFSYSVHSWDSDGNPKWSQPPLKMFNVGFGNVLCPTYDRLAPPQFNEVSP